MRQEDSTTNNLDLMIPAMGGYSKSLSEGSHDTNHVSAIVVWVDWFKEEQKPFQSLQRVMTELLI